MSLPTVSLARWWFGLSEMSRFETELLTQKDNRKGLEQLNVEWVKRGVAKTVHRRIILDIDSSESPVHGQQEGAAYMDKVDWRTSGNTMERVEEVVGRIYRYFLQRNELSVVMQSFNVDDGTQSEVRIVRPNDPLYLMYFWNASPALVWRKPNV